MKRWNWNLFNDDEDDDKDSGQKDKVTRNPQTVHSDPSIRSYYRYPKIPIDTGSKMVGFRSSLSRKGRAISVAISRRISSRRRESENSVCELEKVELGQSKNVSFKRGWKRPSLRKSWKTISAKIKTRGDGFPSTDVEKLAAGAPEPTVVVSPGGGENDKDGLSVETSRLVPVRQ